MSRGGVFLWALEFWHVYQIIPFTAAWNKVIRRKTYLFHYSVTNCLWVGTDVFVFDFVRYVCWPFLRNKNVCILSNGWLALLSSQCGVGETHYLCSYQPCLPSNETVACFANAGTVEARSLESGTQQKENEVLCEVCISSRAGASCLPSLPSLRVAVA
jgi:hypothetical protein